MSERAHGVAARRIAIVVDRLLHDVDVAQDAELARDLGAVKARAASTAASAEELEIEISRLLFQSGQQRAAQLEGLPYPIYDHLQDLAENEEGPWAPTLPERPQVPGRKWRLLGKDIGLPIGIPASVLTMNAAWVAAHAQNGFNVLTYKTVRRKRRPALSQPNWIFVDGPVEPLSPADVASGVRAVGDTSTWPRSLHAFSTANSFGVPSKDPDDWVPDVRAALKALGSDQLLIVSVMGTFEELSGQQLVQDFVEVACLAANAGATAIELNLSCPNGVKDGRALPPLFEDPAMVESVVRSVRAALDPTVALVAKCGYLETSRLRATLGPVAGLLDGVSGINTLQVPVRNRSGQPTFRNVDGSVRSEAGLSGSALRELALRFVQDVAELRKELGLSFDIIGMGGVITSDDAVALYEAGASAVQSASGAFYNPYLARRLVEDRGEDFPRHEALDFVDVDQAVTRVMGALERRGRSTAGMLAADLLMDPAAVRGVIDMLVMGGKIHAEGSASASERLNADGGDLPLYVRI